jgi:hypothetical protein
MKGRCVHIEWVDTATRVSVLYAPVNPDALPCGHRTLRLGTAALRQWIERSRVTSVGARP